MTTKEQRDELRKAAMAAEPIETDLYGDRYLSGPHSQANLSKQQDVYFRLANPQTILALLDQLDSQQPAETRTYEDGLLRAAEICREQAKDSECPERATYCAEAIEQEAKR